MDWSRHTALSEQWQAESLAYVSAVNAFIQRSAREADPGPPPTDTRAPLAMAVLDVVKEANRAGEIEELRRRFAPAHEPFVEHIKQNAIAITTVAWCDESIYAVIGWPGATESTVRLRLDGRVTKATPILCVGTGRATGEPPGGFADRIEHQPPRGSRRRYRIPSGLLGPAYLRLEALPDGRGVLAVFPEGVFLCRESSAQRLFPIDAADEVPRRRFAMIHAALSPDGTKVVCGHQDSQHHVLDLEGRVLCTFGPVQSYPNHATFSPDGQIVLAGSCHMHNGVIVAANVAELHGASLERWKEDPRLQLIHRGFSVTASTFAGDEYIVGDRNGYLLGYGLDGSLRWEHACGSTITGIAASPDGTQLAVGTAAGVLHIIALHCTDPEPFQIGTANHREILRFIRWRGVGLLRW